MSFALVWSFAVQSLLLFPLALAGPPATGWETLTDGAVTVSCTRAGAVPWCRASGHIDAPPDRVYAILDDIDGHARLFSRIAVSSELEPGLAHQVVSLPYPLPARDYVVHLDRIRDGQDRVITFSSVSRPDIPVTGLRLTAFAGEFRVGPDAGGGSRFSYLWQADLGPDIPAFALPIAWRSQGTEIVSGLREAAE